MALPVLKPVSRRYAWAYLTSVTDATSCYTVSPVRGRITKVFSALYAAITTADDLITVAINGTTVTGATITIATASSAPGDIDSAVPTSLALSRVNEGDTISFASNGASDTAAPAMFCAEIEMD